jgi:DNA replication and repair protein RecF
MILKNIILKNFRNYSEQKFLFNDKFNFIFGNNGHGKTNILEAVSYTAFGKSFLGSAETDCIKFGESEFFIESEFENDLGNTDRIVVNYNSTMKLKSIHKNREKVSAFSSEIFGKYPIVFLSPKSLTITYGNPSDRRKFFDILISQASPLYLDYLKELAKILKQKNALLRNYSLFKKYSFGELKNLLNSYNEKLVDISSNIIFKRINFLSGFESFFEKNFLNLNQNHTAEISYFSDALGEIQPGRNRPGLNFIKNRIEEFISGKFDEEIGRAITLAGPQRDDYIFKLQKNKLQNNETFELKNFASQGEHKTFLVALKLSEYDYLKDKKSTSPVLLLDDVLSELDDQRVSKIISHLKDYGQIFLTTTDKSYSESLKEFYEDREISAFEIENGNLKNTSGKFIN